MKSVDIQEFLGLRTIPHDEGLFPAECKDIQDICLARRTLNSRNGYRKFNTTAFGGAINGIYDYKNRWGKFVMDAATDGSISAQTVLNCNFVGTPLKGDINLTVFFMDITPDWNAEITWWYWDFGDYTNSSEQFPSHVYKVPGIYKVKLTVGTGSASFTCSKANYVEVTGLIPDFLGLPLQGNKPLTVAFFDTTFAKCYTITAWAWTFGDGGTSTEQNPTHEYTIEGQYDVQLTLTTSGASFVKKITKYVTVLDPEDTTTVVVDFIGEPVEGEQSLSVKFTDLTINTASLLVGTITDTYVDHFYTDTNYSSHVWNYLVRSGISGEYTRVFIKCPANKTLSMYLLSVALPTAIEVYEVDPATFDIATVTWNTQPALGDIIDTYLSPATAGWEEISTGTTGAICIKIQDETSGDKSRTWYSSDYSNTTLRPKLVVPYAWTFGDGGTSTEQNPMHVYNAVGIYDVQLTVGT